MFSRNVANVRKGRESSTLARQYSEHHFGLFISKIPYVESTSRRSGFPHRLGNSVALRTARIGWMSSLTCLSQDGKSWKTSRAGRRPKLEDVQSTGNGLLGQEACADLSGRFPPRILEI